MLITQYASQSIIRRGSVREGVNRWSGMSSRIASATIDVRGISDRCTSWTGGAYSRDTAGCVTQIVRGDDMQDLAKTVLKGAVIDNLLEVNVGSATCYPLTMGALYSD